MLSEAHGLRTPGKNDLLTVLDEYDNILKFSKKEMDHICKCKIYRNRLQLLKIKHLRLLQIP
jgi:hypothetical protein